MMARILPACLLCCALSVATPALAQQARAVVAQSDPAQVQPDTTLTMSPYGPAGPVFGDDNPNRKVFAPSDAPDGRSGPLASVGKTLADDGILFRALLTNEFADSVAGGASRGNTNVGQFYFGADLDLQRIVGWNGASLHFTVYRDYGTGDSKHVTGTFFKQQDIYKNEFPEWHFGLFALEQRLWDDRLDVIFGRLGTTAYYGHLQSNCYFQSGATCGVPTVLNSEAGFGLLPSATWGTNVKYSFSRAIYAETGAFEVNPTIAPTTGLDFSTTGATGVTVPFELGYQDANFRTTAYPTELKGGYYASTAARADTFFNAKGQSAALTGSKLRNANSLREGVYLMGDRTIWRPDPSSNQSLTAFAGIIEPLENDEVIDRQVYGGLILRQPFESRPRDTVDFSVSWFHVSPGEMDFLRDSRIHAGGVAGAESPNEINFELNYGIGIGRAIRLTPNIQYAVNPESSNLPNISFVPKNIVTFGIKLTIDLASLSGLPGQEASSD
jgi:porin